MKTKIKLFPYSGNKLWFVDKFNELVLNYLGKTPDVIVEPFCGSAVISLNSNAQKMYLNDFDKNIYLMIWSVLNSDYSLYEEAISLANIGGSIKENKEAYYRFRNNWNELYYTSDNYKSNQAAGLYLLILAGACINSMLRFGPTGMNQSWGHRYFEISKNSFNFVSKNPKINLTNLDFYSEDYQKFLTTLQKDSVIFLDPPYEFREMTYNKGFKVTNFIDILKDKNFAPNSLLMYTDFENTISDELLNYGFEKMIIRDMKSTSPNRKNENKTGNEVLYIRKPLN